MIFSFNILHYKTTSDTISCVESILALDVNEEDDVHIVIVDNASNNGSIELIEEAYKKVDNIHILKNKENLGFAKGNNEGYTYSKKILKADFISILNNDIVIKTKDYIKQINQAYQNYSFHVLGPDIVSMVDNGHQNPMQLTNTNVKSIKKEILRYQILLRLSKLNIYDALQRLTGSKTISASGPVYKEHTCIDCQLHGSFLVFSPLYVNVEEFAFFPKTFLYCEEAILLYHCLTKGYHTLYFPHIIVGHKEDSSTNSVWNTPKSKREFIFEHLINSRIIFLKLLIGKENWE